MNRIIWLALFLSTSPVLAAGTANAPIGCESDQTFYPLGYYWAVTPPLAQNPIVLHQSAGEPNTGGGTSISAATAAAAVQRGFAEWGETTAPRAIPI